MDFQACARLCEGMTDCTEDLIVQLCTRAGSAMEDMSVIALTISALPAEERGAAIHVLEESVEQMLALIIAARSLDQ